MDVAHVRLRVDGLGGHVEGPVLDVVAHAGDHPVAVGFGVHQGTAVGQLEEAVAIVDDLVADVEIVMGEPRVELEDLEDGVDAVTLDPHDAPQPRPVDGARPPPLLDGQPFHLLHAVGHADGRAHRAVEDVHGEGVLTDEPHQCIPREVLVAEVGSERAGVVAETFGGKVRRGSGALGHVACHHLSKLSSRQVSNNSPPNPAHGPARSGSSASAPSAPAWPRTFSPPAFPWSSPTCERRPPTPIGSEPRSPARPPTSPADRHRGRGRGRRRPGPRRAVGTGRRTGRRPSRHRLRHREHHLAGLRLRHRRRGRRRRCGRPRLRGDRRTRSRGLAASWSAWWAATRPSSSGPDRSSTPSARSPS